MLALHWMLVNAVTITLYILIVLFLPFSQQLSSVFLFALIGFWSRLPGVGTPPPGEWLVALDLVDIFSLVIAINIGGLQGALFSLAINLGSRVCGFYPDWYPPIIKDALAQFFVCLIIPFVHTITGGNILTSMVLYSILRMLMFFPLRILPSGMPFPQFVLTVIAGGIILTIINSIYASVFGNFFDNLLQKGVSFSWTLFLFATVIIFGTKIYLRVLERKSG